MTSRRYEENGGKEGWRVETMNTMEKTREGYVKAM